MDNSSVVIPSKILKLKDISNTDKIIYGRIYCFNPKPCYMRTSDFIQELGFTRITILKSLRNLKSKNLVKESTYGGLEAIVLND